ncbi:MAG: leucyl aminopeptidase family protein [Aestuariivita sp.]|nr:leucyl aminopeptidase family protein [Aestuariivita sp.]
MNLSFASNRSKSTPLVILKETELEVWLKSQNCTIRNWVTTNGFKAKFTQVLPIPNSDGLVDFAVMGIGNSTDYARNRFVVAAAVQKLPVTTYRISSEPPLDQKEIECLGWLLSHYRFDHYKNAKSDFAQLIAPEDIDAKRIEIIANSEVFIRDLINTPASEMNPVNLEYEVRKLSEYFGAEIMVVMDETQLESEFPMIHTVGRASVHPPRLIDMKWGSHGPSVVLVGKGVCFDTGGLNLKPGSSMNLMKKDMSGAATVLGLAKMIMHLGLAIRLRVLIPAVENSISGNSFRPQDILTSRKGITVEVNNTDAEGRLILADALTLADDETPDLLISMATLTGSARVAVGPDIAPFFCDNDQDALIITEAGARVADPVWRMPFHTPYEEMIEPITADLDNAPSGSFAGSITAALFLRRFVTNTPRFIHFDIFGWQPKSAPGQPEGGVGQGARALLEALPRLLDL